MLKEDKLKNGGKNTLAGLESAMSLIDPFQFTANENQSLDAQNVFKGYEVQWADLKQKDKNVKKSVSELKRMEKQAYYAASTGAKAKYIASGDIAGLVSFTRESLNEHLYRVQEALLAMDADGQDIAAMQDYADEAQRRYRDMERLEDDILNGDGSGLGEYGVFNDGDKNGIDGIFIAKANDLPPGMDKDRYAVIDETAQILNVEGGNIPVYGEKFIDVADGKTKVQLGNKEWTETPGVLGFRYNKKSDPSYVSKDGSFAVNGFAVKHNPLKKDMYFKGITGEDANGDLVRTTFYSPDGEKVFKLDDEMTKNFESDSFMGKKVKDARELDPSFINSVREEAEPMNYTPFTPEMRESAMQPKTVTPQVPASETQEQPLSSHFERKNTPTKPKEPVVGFSTPDIIEKGRAIFQSAKSAFFAK